MVKTSKCTGTNKDGGPCSATPQAGKSRCLWHDPALTEQRKQWSRDAGKAKASSARARKKVLAGGMELQEIDGALCQALTDVLSGELEPGIGTAAATIARTITAVRQAGELEQRITALESRRGWSA